MVALSSITGSGAASSETISYSWGRPKFASGLNFSQPCASLVTCVCSAPVCTKNGVGISTCFSSLNPPQIYPLGDTCFVIASPSRWGVYGQVYSIANDGTVSTQGDWRCIYDWGHAISCKNTGSCCITCACDVALCCASDRSQHVANADAAGRFYVYGIFGCQEFYSGLTNYCTRVNLQQFCWDSATCSWAYQCQYTNASAQGGGESLSCVEAALSNPMTGVIVAKACNCTCNNRAVNFLICGTRTLTCLCCGGLQNPECHRFYSIRTGDNSLILIPDGTFGACCSAVATKFVITFSDCTVSAVQCYPFTYLPLFCGSPGCGNVPNIGYPPAGTSLDFLYTSVYVCLCNTTYTAYLCNSYFAQNGSSWTSLIVDTNACTNVVCDNSLYRSKASEWFFGNSGGTNCVCCGITNTCENRCQFSGFGPTMKNGYYVEACGGTMYDARLVTKTVDYAPFDIAVGKICLSKGIVDKTGCLCTCTRDVALVGDSWVVQLCCNPAPSCNCLFCFKITTYKYSTDC